MLETQVGAIIRLNRIHQNISVRGLAEIVGIEYSQLSKIERGMESSNPVTMESIFEALDLNYHQTIDYLPVCIDKVHKLYHDILYRKSREELLMQLEELNEDSHKMGLTTSLLLVNLVFDLLWQQPCEYDTLIAALSKVEDTMSLMQRQIFKQYQGSYQFIKGNFNDAIKMLEEAETFYMDIGNLAMISYQKGVIYAKHGDFLEAFESLGEAKRLFEQHHNYVRSAFCSVCIANIHLMTGKYRKSRTLYEEMLEVYHNFGLGPEDKLIICNNLLYLCILMEEYDNFLPTFESFDEDVRQLMEKYPQYFYYQMMVAYHKDDMELCKKAIERFEALNQDPVDKYMARYYRLKIDGAESKELIKVLDHNLKAIEKTSFPASNRIVLKLMLKEHQHSKDYKTLYKYALKLCEIKM